ncbi:hypothetical protein ACS0TY_024599 [Phlomoides rotata]
MHISGMESDQDNSMWPPMCWYKTGHMVLLQAGTDRNLGRYFYKCPRNVKHPSSFVWCDEWHQHDPPSIRPAFLKFQNPNISYYSHSVSSSRSISPMNHHGMLEATRP